MALLAVPVGARVVLVTLDAGSDATVKDLLARGILPRQGAFGRMMARGTWAEALDPVNVSSTPIVHASLYSGTWPAAHGIVGVSVPILGGDIRAEGEASNGFSAPTERDRIWTLAARHGKRVTCITAPGAGASRLDDTCTFTVAFPASLSQAVVGELGPMDKAPALELRPRAGGTIPLHVFSLGPESSHRYRVSALSGSECVLDRQSPCTILLPMNGATRWVWAQILDTPSEQGHDRLYASPLIEQTTNDPAHLAEMQRAIGYSPVEADNRLTNRGIVSESVWLADSYLMTDYISRAVQFTLRRNDWDLLLTYVPLLDQVQHRYLLSDSRQADYDAEGGARRRRYQRIVEQAYLRTDAMLTRWMERAPRGTSFIVVSDHGMVPTHSTVRILNLLTVAGFRVSDRGETDVWARGPGGASSHIYVNAKSRFARGTVRNEAVAPMVEHIVKAFQEFRDPGSGETVFEIVRRHSELGDLGLDNPKSGDVFVATRPGWSVSARYSPGGSIVVRNAQTADTIRAVATSEADRLFLESGGANETSLGVHGHVARPRTIDAIFMAYGARVPRKRIGRIADIDVLPSVFDLLGIATPDGLEGRSVWASGRNAR